MIEVKKTEAKSGHAAHTKASDKPEGLPGNMPRQINVTVLGAGSSFCSTLCRDIILIPNNQGGEFRLVDINEDRLAAMHKVIQRLIQEMGVEKSWKVKASSKRRDVLVGTDYAICCVEVSGVECVAWENDIPLKYGVDQCIGDTIGPGGLFKGLRTVPVFLDILRDMRELCPKATMLNYTNPMNMMVLAAGRAVPEIAVVGLCHSVQGTSHLLAEYSDIPYSELEWECAGINHLAWFTRLEHKSKDLYTSHLYEQFSKDIAEARIEAQEGRSRFDSADLKWESEEWANRGFKQSDVIRKDMCVHFGAFITESSGHLSEYLPYYRKSPDGQALLRLAYDGGSRFYATNWPNWRNLADKEREMLVSGEKAFDFTRSWEYGSYIIESMEKDVPYRIHGNVMNYSTRVGQPNMGESGKLITNLPGDGCVEVACLVDRNGIQPIRYGALPPQMAHICASNMAMFDLAASAIIERSIEKAIYSLYLDPLCQAVLSPAQIKAMTLEIFEAEKTYLTEYA